jgi:hypothetical protein
MGRESKVRRKRSMLRRLLHEAFDRDGVTVSRGQVDAMVDRIGQADGPMLDQVVEDIRSGHLVRKLRRQA